MLAPSKEAFDTPLSPPPLNDEPGPATGHSGVYPDGTSTRRPGPASRTQHDSSLGRGEDVRCQAPGLLSAKIRADHPHLPLILLGHSMGSFAVQQYLLDHSADVDGVVLTGTAAIDLLEAALDLDQPLDLAMFNAAFQSSRTDYDWLSRDEAVVDAYIADPACGFGIDTIRPS